MKRLNSTPPEDSACCIKQKKFKSLFEIGTFRAPPLDKFHVTCLENLFGVEGFANELLHVSSSQEDGGHHSHQHPGEDEAEPNATVESRQQQ